MTTTIITNNAREGYVANIANWGTLTLEDIDYTTTQVWCQNCLLGTIKRLGTQDYRVFDISMMDRHQTMAHAVDAIFSFKLG